MAVKNLTAAKVRHLLDYNGDTGKFVWLRSAGKAVAGAEAGCIRDDGYVSICVDGTHVLAHRLAMLLFFGQWPKNDVDHLNGDRADNRILNLRPASVQVNRQNVRAAKAGSASGLLGAYFDARNGRWYSNIRAGGKRVPLGRFDSAQHAHEAYIAAKRRLHPGCTI